MEETVESRPQMRTDRDFKRQDASSKKVELFFSFFLTEGAETLNNDPVSLIIRVFST